MLLSNWEEDIVYAPGKIIRPPVQETDNLTTPANKSLESGAWTQSIIWGPGAPFRDFTQLELNEEDLAAEERPTSMFDRLLRVSWVLIVFSGGNSPAAKKVKSGECTISR